MGIESIEYHAMDTMVLCPNAVVNVANEMSRKSKLVNFGTLKRLELLVNVGKRKGQTFIGGISNSGNHWVLVVVELRPFKRIIYCDTLASDSPVNILEVVNSFTNHIPRVGSYDGSTFCTTHSPLATSRRLGHVCDWRCRNYPLQTLSDICGVIALISAALATFDRSLFQYLIGPYVKETIFQMQSRRLLQRSPLQTANRICHRKKNSFLNRKRPLLKSSSLSEKSKKFKHFSSEQPPTAKETRPSTPTCSSSLDRDETCNSTSAASPQSKTTTSSTQGSSRATPTSTTSDDDPRDQQSPSTEPLTSSATTTASPQTERPNESSRTEPLPNVASRFQCQDCGLQLSSRQCLYKHKMRKHKTTNEDPKAKESKHVCPECTGKQSR